MLRNALTMLGEGLLELIYPSNIYCISCGNIIDDSRPYSLCDTCVRTMKWANGRTCGCCGKILLDDYASDLCADCTDTVHVFEKGYTCVEYGPAERNLLLQFKYKDKAYLGRKLAEIMYDRIAAEDADPDLILPVPMFLRKEKKRGYNQAAVLGKYLSEKLRKPILNRILIRTAETTAMSSLGAAERRRNIQEAFIVPSKKRVMIQEKKILLVDDIYTTGSTADACSQALLEAGAASVCVFTFASGANRMQDTDPKILPIGSNEKYV